MRTGAHHPNYSIININQNTEKIPEESRGLAVNKTPEKEKPTLVWKNSQRWASWRMTPSNKWKWKTIFFKKYLRRTRKLLETKLSSRNLIKGIITWAVPLIRYSGRFLKWTRDELKQMDQRTRKLMTMHKALHPRRDVDRLYVSRKEGGRGLAITEYSIDASIQRLKDYMEKHEWYW